MTTDDELRAAWLAGAQWATRRWTGHEVDPRDFDPVIDEFMTARTDASS